jgi:hypothetical protein
MEGDVGEGLDGVVDLPLEPLARVGLGDDPVGLRARGLQRGAHDVARGAERELHILDGAHRHIGQLELDFLFVYAV